MPRNFCRRAIGLVFLLLVGRGMRAQPFDPAVFERVLVPVSVSLVPGAYGTVWSTELWYRNNSRFPVAVLPVAVSDAVPTIARTVRLLIPNRPPSTPGEFVYVTRGYLDQVQFDLRLFNRADPFGEWDLGTKLPVVREAEFAARIDLINVRIGPQLRAALRIYGLSDDASSATIKLYSNDEELLASADVPLLGMRGFGEPPYAGITSLASAFPAIQAKDRVRIQIESREGAKLWAFAATTSTITQHVVIVTPN